MTFTCFGEILWDIFPDRRHLGGAPLNVAHYLNQLGNRAQLISAVGRDELGDEALKSETEHVPAETRIISKSIMLMVTN